ncbi:MAG TPA: hypothetical protein PLZ51_29220, partial [Aggregatilineales bacterium]|nr:hypothetical protein [Aggregatilineales bacterium]
SAQTPIFSAENPIITPQNASQVTQLAMIGRGIPERTAYSPDGNMIAVSSSVGIWLYDTNDLSAEPRLLSDKAQYGHIIPITFSPDSHFIAGGTGGELYSNQGSVIYIWDVKTNELMHTLTGHT